MKATLVQWGSTPKVTVELAIAAGNAHETAEQVWLADLTAALMREGTPTRTAQQHLGGGRADGRRASTSPSRADTTEIATDVLSEFAPQAVALVADVARNPRFPESELARLKTDKLRELSIAQQQPAADRAGEVPLRALRRARLRPRSSRARPQLSGYTLAQVRDFYAKNFGAARAHLYVVGRFEPAAGGEGDPRCVLGLGRRARARGHARRSRSPTRGVHLVDRPGAVQSTLIVGMPVIDPSQPDYVPLVVTNTLLGGYFSSRMTANLREQKGYTYSPFSQLSSRRATPTGRENADVTTAVTGPSLKEIFYEIDRLQAEPPPGGGAAGGEELRRGHLRAATTRRAAGSSTSWSSSTCTACPRRTCATTWRASTRSRRPRSSRWRRSTSRTTRRRSWSWATGRYDRGAGQAVTVRCS